jgi:molecular chaperone HscB
MQGAATRERQCWKCGGNPGAGLACARCEVVQPLSREADLFAILGVPRRLAVDPTDLERRYHAASRVVHPDRYQTAGARERELSLAASAAVNRAYRTLRDPVALGRYWLELHGRRLGDEGPAVPPEIAAEVFETQEKLEELRAATGAAGELRAEVGRLRDRLAAKDAALRDDLVTLYAKDEAASLDELQRRLSEIAYLCTLLADVDDTIGEGIGGTHRRH